MIQCFYITNNTVKNDTSEIFVGKMLKNKAIWEVVLFTTLKADRYEMLFPLCI